MAEVEVPAAATAMTAMGEITDNKHPLEHAWTFWFDSPSGKNKQQQWGSSLRSVHTVSTVEDFWCIFNHLIQPSRLISGADFHCFKEGVKPEWEDPNCANGGKWTVAPPKGSKTILDHYWLNTLLAMIGEQFDEGDEICGVVVNVRQRQDKISLWTKTASNEAAQMRVGKQWKEFLDYSERLGYTFHEDAKRPEKTRSRYTV